MQRKIQKLINNAAKCDKNQKLFVSLQNKTLNRFKRQYIMCQTVEISRHIGRIGRRSFDRRMRLASPLFVERQGEVARILNEVDRLSDRLHDEFITITEDDYRMFGPELKIVISTLKALRRESQSRPELRRYDERMREQILDLEELDHDIVEFRIKAPKDEKLQQTLASIKDIDFSYLFK